MDDLRKKISAAEQIWQKLHEEACARGEHTYTDPATGYQVFTRLHHVERGVCCKSGCRHCAYGYNKEERVKSSEEKGERKPE